MWVLLRSLLWLAAVVALLPPGPDGRDPALRISLVGILHAARAQIEEASGLCDRQPDACAASGAVPSRLATADSAVPPLLARLARSTPAGDAADRGTLREPDLEPAWSLSPGRR